MTRLVGFAAATVCTAVATLTATPPTELPPLEVRLAKMKLIVAGQLDVTGEGSEKHVSLRVSRVLKRPAGLTEVKAGTVVAVMPRPEGFSDQAGDGVWSLETERKGDRLIVTRYEFITYGRDIARIEEAMAASPGGQETAGRAPERAEALKRNLKVFQLLLIYHGPQDKPYYNLTLSVPRVRPSETNPFHPIVHVDIEQAGRIVDRLASDGFLAEASDITRERIVPPSSPGYSMRVNGEEISLQAELGWNLGMLKTLDGLKSVLDGDAAESMELLLGRLSGHRREWETDEAAK
jgi:hypothetical protein